MSAADPVTLRCFVAVELDEAQRRAVTDVSHRMKEVARRGRLDVRWVPVENLHFTLKFLGPVPADGAGRVIEALHGEAARHGPFDLSLAGAGVFPHVARPRIVWLGVRDGRAPLEALAASVTQALVPLGFAPEDRPFTAHVTLGRVRAAPRQARTLTEAVVAAPGDGLVGPVVHVASFVLMRSDLDPGGAVYTPIEHFPLSSTSTLAPQSEHHGSPKHPEGRPGQQPPGA